MARMTRFLALAAGAAAVAVLTTPLAAGPAAAQERPMTVTSLYGKDKPQSQVWYRFRDIVDRELPGQFDIKVVTDGALGGEKEEAEGILLGSIAASLSTIANLTTWVPEGALFDMPFMFRDANHINKVLSGPIGDEFKAKYAEQGFKVFGFIIYGARHVISKEPIRTPDDVKGKKMRVLQSPLHIDLWSSLGASPTPVPITEAYNALETGVVDYMDMTMSGYHALKLFEVVPNFTRTAHIWALGVMYMGMNYWDSLNEEQKAVFESAAAESIPYFNELAAAEQEASLAKTVEAGTTVIEPDNAVWQKAMEPFWESYADKVGGLDRVKRIATMQ